MVDTLTRRNWLQLTIRGALAITASGAVLFALFRKRLEAARVQEDVVLEIERIGGVLGYAHEWDNNADRFSGLPTPGPELIRTMTGDHFYLVPDMVMFDEFEGTASDLARLAELTTITQLSVTHGPNVDDALVDILLQLPTLEVVNLYGTSLTLEGLSRLHALPNLRTLHVSHTIRDATEADTLGSLFGDGVVQWSDEPYTRTSELFDTIENGT
jgi:hypothetical protein